MKVETSSQNRTTDVGGRQPAWRGLGTGPPDRLVGLIPEVLGR